MAEKRCEHKCGAWNCASYQFNLYKDDIDQGNLCDVHYWQTKAQREWVGLTDEKIREIHSASAGKDVGFATGLTEAKLKELNHG
jgi:hypothetical protein